MNKLESGELILEETPFDLRILLKDCWTILEFQAAKMELTFEPIAAGSITRPYVIGRPLHVRQIFTNILSNAIKYNKRGGKISVSARAAASTEDSVSYEFTIADTGIGMSQEYLEHIFEPFSQEDPGARTTYHGTGLGMSIVHRLVDSMGGTIRVESEKNVGSRFIFTLPFQLDPSPKSQNPAENEPPAADISGMHILIVEDNELNREIAQYLLEDAGATVTAVCNGLEGYQKFVSSPPETFDLILMDIMMPVMDGLEAATKIRSCDHPDALIIPIVAGMGINFAITIGAMAAQIACLLVLEWGVSGIGGLALAALLTVPLGGIFGFLIGKLLNKMKGQEMIGSMILGYFANGLYQLLFLFIFDNIIPIHNPNLTIKGSTGIANTMDLSREGGFAYSLEKLWQLPASQAAIAFAVVAALVLIVGYVTSHRKNAKKLGVQLAVIAAAAAVMQLPAMKNLFSMVNVPMATFGVVALLCLFNVVIMRTRLGQQFRAVGQNGVVANAAGIDVDRVRIIAIVFSTILAGWGQLIFVQNMGSFQTYGAHEQVGLYAGAAILVGGASVVRATNTQALVGCVLFHLMFILAPAAGKNLFGDAAIGEYFRVFICYGVIALSLVMHAWSENNRRKQAASALRADNKA